MLLTPPAGPRGVDRSLAPCCALLTGIAARFSSASASLRPFCERVASIRPSSESATKWPGRFLVAMNPVPPIPRLKAPTAIAVTPYTLADWRAVYPAGTISQHLGHQDLLQGGS